jgi:hypothetical protein
VLGPSTATVSVADFRFAFVGAGLICLVGVLDFLWLDAGAGSAVSGHRQRKPAGSAI